MSASRVFLFGSGFQPRAYVRTIWGTWKIPPCPDPTPVQFDENLWGVPWASTGWEASTCQGWWTEGFALFQLDLQEIRSTDKSGQQFLWTMILKASTTDPWRSRQWSSCKTKLYPVCWDSLTVRISPFMPLSCSHSGLSNLTVSRFGHEEVNPAPIVFNPMELLLPTLLVIVVVS